MNLFDQSATVSPHLAPANFSPCRCYRYTLCRRWDDSRPMVAFCCLNPSTADETKGDRTCDKVKLAAHRWGYGGMWMLNIFAFCATDPRDMKAAVNPVGPDNDQWLLDIAGRAALIVCAWGAHGEYQGMGAQVREILSKYSLHYLHLTKDGHPGHPLYLPNTAMTPKLWTQGDTHGS